MLAVATAVALLVSVPIALADERSDYIAQVEPICKSNSTANSRILKGADEQVKDGQLVPAGKRFVRAASALGKAVQKIDAVPRPAADEKKLTEWIGHLKSQRSYLQQIGQALKGENRDKAYRLAVGLKRVNTKANNTVISFGFDECRIDSSRFI